MAVAAHFGYNRSHEVLITVIYNLLDAGKDMVLGIPFSPLRHICSGAATGFQQADSGDLHHRSTQRNEQLSYMMSYMMSRNLSPLKLQIFMKM